MAETETEAPRLTTSRPALGGGNEPQRWAVARLSNGSEVRMRACGDYVEIRTWDATESCNPPDLDVERIGPHCIDVRVTAPPPPTPTRLERPMRTPEELERVLLERSNVDPNTGCRRWLGAHTPAGYGQLLHGKTRSVHQLAYELWVGPIPVGLELDHVYARGCRHRDCINIEHLEAVTHQENLRRRSSLAGLGGSGECHRGHARIPGVHACGECAKVTAPCPSCGRIGTVKNRNRHAMRCAGSKVSA